MEANVLTINLQDFRTPASKVFTGRPRGKGVRIDSKIDESESQYAEVNIIIPNDIASINPSFLEEFLQTVVLKYGESGFHKKFKFINEGAYKIANDLEEAIDRLLREESSLATAL